MHCAVFNVDNGLCRWLDTTRSIENSRNQAHSFMQRKTLKARGEAGEGGGHSSFSALA